ncbi:MAG TPA: ABC transporter ATP-binding protein [Candidatus Egerieimonas intestinavium]|uniref:ABC transporter ATP-binding protein n=1 Tax=Candidatus Egerieimonas intestinavium TaxID=2840777 RepID=A0A9D1EK69_9FIRM|nr:ABC transporter ATP-binding protein [Candidatus Egerieimonas intestinavium]
MSDLMRCEHLTKYYGSKIALSDVNLRLESGKIVGLLGPNGSGKTTLIKLINGLLVPSQGLLTIAGEMPGIKTKAMVSYLPERMYLGNWMRVNDVMDFFSDFYEDFDLKRAMAMLDALNIKASDQIRHMSKGTKEKVQLILVMSRRAKLYCLDEPIAGVDPAARDYILNTILTNYDPEATILISTHLISDIENILDEVIFIQNGQIKLQDSVDNIRCRQHKSVDALFREVFKC